MKKTNTILSGLGINVFLYPFKREFLYMCLDFFTTAFFLVPGTEVYEAFWITSVLLDNSYIPIERVNNLIWKQIAGEFGGVGEYLPLVPIDKTHTSPSTPSTASSSSSSSLSTFKYWSAEDDFEYPDSY